MSFHAELSDNTVDKCMYITFGLIIFSALFERALHALEQWINVYARYYVETLNVIYKELMMLGIISLFLTVLTSLVEDEYWSLSFEFVHLSLFISSMLHIIFAVLMVTFGVKWCRFWKETEKQGMQFIEQRLLTTKEHRSWTHAVINPKEWAVRQYLLWKRDYLIVREVFIWQNNLQEWFDFTMYVRKRVRAAVRHLVVIHYSVWVILLCILMVSLLAYKAEMRSGETAFIFAAWSNCCLTMTLYVKSNEMLQRFIKDHKSIHRRRTLQTPLMKRPDSATSLQSNMDEAHRLHLFSDSSFVYFEGGNSERKGVKNQERNFFSRIENELALWVRCYHEGMAGSPSYL
eukprot:TRINITY_DN5302_c0_g1_i3.p1 TRINITY_DN5302_c0_g1~~TRINITY_DN5302_c0_g1_i3.p1  ORF type:complete len:346 (+),score=57.01 TRINITY_DN5302_c0_g1_i3:51-1088(+)